MRGAGWCYAEALAHYDGAILTNVRLEVQAGVGEPRFGGARPDDLAVDDGYVRLPDSPGIGFERKQSLYAVMRRLAE